MILSAPRRANIDITEITICTFLKYAGIFSHLFVARPLELFLVFCRQMCLVEYTCALQYVDASLTQILLVVPADTCRNNNAIIASKRCIDVALA